MLSRWWRRVSGPAVSDALRDALAEGEDIVGAAPAHGGHVAVTHLGLWLPGDAGPRRVGWHLVSKAAWSDGVLTVVEAVEVEDLDGAVLLRDLPPVRLEVPRAGRLPELVRRRVESAIRARHRKDLADGGGVWFVLRKVPGTDGVVLQARPDTGTDVDAVRAMAREAAQLLSGDP
ncbi:hypothetical protein BJF85_08875 [Saccharomonospora sp. CUA-673]|uniref:hypothetical protein n=1 Tax=Saccharomonospora sp. CUA-673 TaxID=1904969 RepID=UPI000959C5A9|nr:hypothetical protein [Saccharomonospora sp. CUA-673]OLT38554.1 hypothetical protein BJF85_08875 [Saccharomonospora sp. CUA-673]